MRFRITYESSHSGPRNLEITADVTATIGEVAERILSSDPRPGAHSLDRPTLHLKASVARPGRTLSPLLSVQDSGLVSGAVVTVVDAGSRETRTSRGVDRVASLTIVEGGDVGKLFLLSAGVSFIGRDPSAEVQLSDRLVSRRHARVLLAETATIVDLESANGIEVDHRIVPGGVLQSGTIVRVGDTFLRFDALASTNGSPSDSPPVFSRSPRVDVSMPSTTVQLPTLPRRSEAPRVPVLALIAPLVTGLVLFAVTRQVITLAFVAMSPMIMLGTWIDNRIQSRRKNKAEADGFARSLESVRRELTGLRADEMALRAKEAPASSEVVDAVLERSPMLWTRKPEHARFLHVRIGSASLPSRTLRALPPRNSESPDEWEQLAALDAEFDSVSSVPFVESLPLAGAIGIAGRPDACLDVVRAAIVQLVGLHSPADLALGGFVPEPTGAWEWLEWLPHVDSVHTPFRSNSLASTVASSVALAAELEELIDRRRRRSDRSTVRSGMQETERDQALRDQAVSTLPITPTIVVLVIDGCPIERSRLVAIAETGPDVGVYVIWCAADLMSLPVVCRTHVIVSDAGEATVGVVRTGASIRIEELERVDRLTAGALARTLAPLRDNDARVLDETDLPRRLNLLDVIGSGVVDTGDGVLARWRRTDSIVADWRPGRVRPGDGLAATIGIGADGPTTLDLRAHGPHALVAGTTGAGKSEFLQSWILGLATNYSPDRLALLLVDYKGGSAFADCVDLPHTVGYVTDLTPHLVKRALISLKSELRRRERLLVARSSKDLPTLEQRSDPEAPPSFVIVVDELAALIAEVPEFVEGVVDVAQRGRSLGLHLVLATQRPAGVVTPSIRANTNLRIALRVADEADSIDVIGIPAAVAFDPSAPGRAAAKLGHGSVVNFQSGYVGGSTGMLQDQTGVEVAEFEFGRITPWVASGSRGSEESSGPRDIERIVAAVKGAVAARETWTPDVPWTDPLPDVVSHEALLPGAPGEVALGLRDEPQIQRQGTLSFHPDRDGSILFVGASGTGKSASLGMLALGLSLQAPTDPLWIYGFDFTGGSLRSIEALPTVGSIVGADDSERILRLAAYVQTEVEERLQRMAENDCASFDELRRVSERPIPRLLILIDGLAALRSDWEFRSGAPVWDSLLRALPLARRAGVTFAVTADRMGTVPAQMLAHLPARFVFRLALPSDYTIAGVSADALADAPPGRAVYAGSEVQLAALGADPWHREKVTLDYPAPVPIRRLPATVHAADLPNLTDGAPTLGLADSDLEPIGLPAAGLFLVAGPASSGKTTTIRTLLRNLRAAHRSAGRFVLLSARTGRLHSAIPWDEASTDPAAADELATRLARELEASAETPSACTVVLDRPSDFGGLPADASISQLLRVTRRLGIRVLVETEAVSSAAAWQIQAELRTVRAGVALQPDESDGPALFRVPFPRGTRADFPPGRGLLVADGRVSKIQVAFYDAEEERRSIPSEPVHT